MIDKILKSLASDTTGDLTSKAGVPQNLLGDLFKVTGNVTTQEVTNHISSAGIAGAMNLFSNKPNNIMADNIQNSLTDSLVNNYASKLGLTKQQATLAAGIIVPTVIKLITNENSKTPDNDSSPIQSLFDLENAKGASKAIGGLLGKFLKG